MLGILVDDSSNQRRIQRHLELGAGPPGQPPRWREWPTRLLTPLGYRAAAFARFSCLGDIGQFIYSLPQVVTVTLLASLVVYFSYANRQVSAGFPPVPQAHGAPASFFQGRRAGEGATGACWPLPETIARALTVPSGPLPWPPFMVVCLALCPYRQDLFPFRRPQ